MFIQTLVPPVAGRAFRFTVAGCAGETSIEVYANSAQILKREYNDLVCKSVVEIPPGTEGATLSICATDSTGNNQKLEYEISEANPGPHSMLSKTR
jgi:hypothetical protein